MVISEMVSEYTSFRATSSKSIPPSKRSQHSQHSRHHAEHHGTQYQQHQQHQQHQQYQHHQQPQPHLHGHEHGHGHSRGYGHSNPMSDSSRHGHHRGMRSFMDNVISPFVRCVAPNFDNDCTQSCTPIPSSHFRDRDRDSGVVSPLTDRRYPPSQPTSPRQDGRALSSPTSPHAAMDAADAMDAYDPAGHLVHSPVTSPSRMSHDPAADAEPTTDIEKPHSNDVLCGRGGSSNRHLGNIHFRELVAANKKTYVGLTKKQKMLVARKIVDTVRSASPAGRFLAKDLTSGLWYDIGIPRSLEKTSQALREKNSNDATAVDAKEQVEVISKAGGANGHVHSGKPNEDIIVSMISPSSKPTSPTPDESVSKSSPASPASSASSKGKKHVEAPPLIIPPHLLPIYRPARPHADMPPSMDRWHYHHSQHSQHSQHHQASNESIEQEYTKSPYSHSHSHSHSNPYHNGYPPQNHSRHPVSPPTERYTVPPQTPPTTGSSPYYGSERPPFHSYSRGLSARPAQYDHAEHYDPYNTTTTTSNNNGGSKYDAEQHLHRHSQQQHGYGAEYASPRVSSPPTTHRPAYPPPRHRHHDSHASPFASTQSMPRPPAVTPHHSYGRAPASPLPSPHPARVRHHSQMAATPPPPHQFRSRLPSMHRPRSHAMQYPPSMYPPSPPSFRSSDYDYRPEHFIPRPEAPKSTSHRSAASEEVIHRTSSGYIRSKGEVSPERRQEWKRQRDEDIVRKLSDASLSRAVERRLVLDDVAPASPKTTTPVPKTAKLMKKAKSAAKPSKTATKPPKATKVTAKTEDKAETTAKPAPTLKSPSAVLQSRSRRHLPPKEMAAAETLSGLAALSTAAFLKMDETA